MKAWLENGTQLTESLTVNKLLCSSKCWQIYSTLESMNLLVANVEQAEKWFASGVISSSLFRSHDYEGSKFYVLSSPKKYSLTPFPDIPSPESKEDAFALAHAFKATRDVYPDGTLEGGIYVEQYSRILPLSKPTGDSDDVLIGTWLTGGVNISATSFRRLTKLQGWLSASELLEVLNIIGLPVPPDAGLIAKTKSDDSPYKENKPECRLKTTSENVSIDQWVDEDKFVLPGRANLENFFNEHIIDIIQNSEKYQRMGIEFPSAVILHGPPGCGKTFAVEKLVEYIGWPSFQIDSGSIGSPYIHETGKKISELFDRAIDNAPSIVVIDEMESFLSERGQGGSAGQHHIEEVAEFLRRIPEAISKRVLVIAMTNMIDVIDPAIRRRGRFDHIIEVGMPSSFEVSSLLQTLMKDLPISEEIDMDELIQRLCGRALSDCTFVIREASRLAVKDNKDVIDQSCIQTALSLLPNKEDKNKRTIGFVN